MDKQTEPKSESFWKTTTGMLTALGGLAAGVGTLLGGLVAVGAFDSDPKPVTPIPVSQSVADAGANNAPLTVVAAATDPVAPSGGAYPEEFVTNFMASCEAQGATSTSCACILDSVQQEWSVDEFIEVFQAPTPDPGLEIIIEACS